MPTRTPLHLTIVLIGLIFMGTGLCAAAELKVAVCQIFCLDGDRSGNMVRIENALREAKQAGAVIACFPETALLGWANPAAFTRSFPIPGADSDRICSLAAEYDTYICIGLAEKEGDKLYDSAILVDNKGNVLLKHRKIHVLPDWMSPGYTAGIKIETAATEFGRIGLLICADTFKEDILEEMARQQPDLLLVPYGWAAQQGEWPDHGQSLQKVVKNAALKTGAFVIGTDLVGQVSSGPNAGRVYGGQSVVVDNAGNILMKARDRDRDVKVVSLQLKDD